MSEYIKELKIELSPLTPDEIPEINDSLKAGTGADLYLKKGQNEYAFEIKTVQISKRSGSKYSDTLMEWITFKYLEQKKQSTKINFHAHIVIPYDPHLDSNWWTEFKSRAYPLDKYDVKLGNEFWNLISGLDDTLTPIKQAIIDLKTEGFSEIYLPSLRKSEPSQSITMIEEFCGFICKRTDRDAITFKSNLPWECAQCKKEFTKKIGWFKKNRQCPHCDWSLRPR